MEKNGPNGVKDPEEQGVSRRFYSLVYTKDVQVSGGGTETCSTEGRDELITFDRVYSQRGHFSYTRDWKRRDDLCEEETKEIRSNSRNNTSLS